MRRFNFVALALGLLLCFPIRAHAQSTTEQINNFDAQITVNQDGTIDVVETINYTFGTEYKHGIYREIPKIRTNDAGEDFVFDYRLVSITDESNIAYSYKNESSSKRFKYRIGDEDATITGQHTYVIRYEVSGALTYFSDHDELYWNVTGNEWEVPIESVSATIVLPSTIPTDSVKLICYTGLKGNSSQLCDNKLDDSTARFASNTKLYAYEGLTAAVSFPIGYVDVLEAEPYISFWETIWGKIAIGLIVLVALLWYLYLPLQVIMKWFKHGRDPKVAFGVASAWFEPPQTKAGRKLTPAETGGLVDETVDHPEIAATIVHLAQQGLMKISETKKNKFTLTKTAEANTETLLPFEEALFTGLFKKGETCNLKDADLISTVKTSKDKIYKQLVQEGFFPEDPSKIRARYLALGIVAAGTLNVPLALASFTFGRHMAAKTVAGTEAANVGKSLKNFLVSQDRTLEHQAKTQEFFEKLLPYAIAFGVEKIWAKRFEGLTMEANGWYDSYDTNRMLQTHLLASSLSHAVSQVRSAATPTSSSTGHSSGFSGGFSGGGGGGGGGGSW